MKYFSKTYLIIALIAGVVIILLVFGAIVLGNQNNTGLNNGSSNNQVTLKLGENFKVRINEAAEVEGITVRLVDVTNDSRCPINATCITAGTVQAEVAMNSKSVSKETRATLTLGSSSDKAETVVNTYRIKLLDIQPLPTAGQETTASDYIAEFVVTKI